MGFGGYSEADGGDVSAVAATAGVIILKMQPLRRVSTAWSWNSELACWISHFYSEWVKFGSFGSEWLNAFAV